MNGLWQQFFDPKSGCHYYYHKTTGHIQWDQPHDWWAKGDVHKDYNDWTPVVDDEQNVLFYFNTKTKESQYEAPHSTLDASQCARRHMLVDESNEHNKEMWDRLC